MLLVETHLMWRKIPGVGENTSTTPLVPHTIHRGVCVHVSICACMKVRVCV